MSTNQSTEASSTSTQARASNKRSPMAGPSWLDERVGLAGLMKKQLRKVFPDHWSFMLGEIALWSFVVLLLTGVFLSLWFKPSMEEVSTPAPTPSCAASTCPRRTPRRWTSPSTSAVAC